MQRSWGRIGTGVLVAQQRASMVATEFTSHGFTSFFECTLSEMLGEAWHGQGAMLFVLTG